MKIQSANVITTQSLAFGNKRTTVAKLPKNLRAKPLHKVPKGLLISLIPLSLSGFGIYFWQTHEEEAIERSNKFWLRELFKQWGAEELYESIFGEKTQADNTDETSQNAISMWKTLSNTPVQTPNTISMQDALEKYGAPKEDTTITQNAFLNYVTQSQNRSDKSAEE